jgi:hypothetical protein
MCPRHGAQRRMIRRPRESSEFRDIALTLAEYSWLRESYSVLSQRDLISVHKDSNVLRLAIVHYRRREQAQAGMAMFSVIPTKKSLTESSAILNAPETVRELRPILQSAELAFRVRVVVRDVRPADVPAPKLIGSRSQQFRFLVRRMSPLIATFASFAMLFEQAMHTADRAEILAFIEQRRINSGRGAILETFFVQTRQDLLAEGRHSQKQASTQHLSGHRCCGEPVR